MVFDINYKILSESFDNIDTITEEKIQYDFLLGSVWLLNENDRIEMDWEWIPLLDFSFCLFKIVNDLGAKYNGIETFEFTESNEIIKFSKASSDVRISASFSKIILNTSFIAFEDGVTKFHKGISRHIKKNVTDTNLGILNKFILSEA